MNVLRCRPFNISDAMILVAATAISLPLMPPYWVDCLKAISQGNLGPDAILGVANSSTAILVPSTLAMLLLRLRQPRPAFRRLRNQPGLMACLTAAITATITLIFFFVEFNSYVNADFRVSFFQINSYVAPSVVGSWLTLLLGGRWKAEPGWIDQLGRCLGWLWIVSFLVSTTIYSLHLD